MNNYGRLNWCCRFSSCPLDVAIGTLSVFFVPSTPLGLTVVPVNLGVLKKVGRGGHMAHNTIRIGRTALRKEKVGHIFIQF